MNQNRIEVLPQAQVAHIALYVSTLFQGIGVNFLFISLLVIVIGSFAGQWLAVHGFISDGQINFWLGHQGYESVDLGRFWRFHPPIGLFL